MNLKLHLFENLNGNWKGSLCTWDQSPQLQLGWPMATAFGSPRHWAWPTRVARHGARWLTGNPAATWLMVSQSPRFKLHATTLTPRWEWQEEGPHHSRVRLSGVVWCWRGSGGSNWKKFPGSVPMLHKGGGAHWRQRGEEGSSHHWSWSAGMRCDGEGEGDGRWWRNLGQNNHKVTWIA
jgi:hypothetical protein